MVLSPTLACADPLHLARDLDALKAAEVPLLHLDVMDGHYVPNLAMSLDQIRAIKAYSGLVAEVHLMVTDPFSYVDPLAAAGIERAAFHIDTTPFCLRLAQRMRAAGIAPGAALNPSQPVELLAPILSALDFVVLMSVEPGYNGQHFLESTYDKLRQLGRLRGKAEGEGMRSRPFAIVVDGGIDVSSGRKCAQLGADILVGGAFACFGQPDGIESACRRFQEELAKPA